MNLTHASTYALHAVAYMAAQKSDAPIASHKIAVEKGIPERFLLKVLKPLVDAQVLESIKGPNGGYRLARPASNITVLEILQAVEPGSMSGSVPQPKANREKFPNFNPSVCMPLYRKLDNLCKQSAELVRNYLETVKLSDLVRR